MHALHSKKVDAEKNAFIAELYNSLPSPELLMSGKLGARARALHEALLPAYILKHYVPRQFQSNYLEVLFTNLIEAESLLILGFQNAGLSTLRSGLESSLKFLYYEHHPIELELHVAGEHGLTSTDYRDFLYSFPRLKSLEPVKKEHLEALWTALCQYVHCDLRALNKMSVVSDLRSALSDSERKFQQTLDLLRRSASVVVAVLLAIEPRWLESAEAAYFDAVLEAFSPQQRKEVLSTLRIL